MTDDLAVTRKQLAAELGVSPSYVNALRDAGRVVLAEDRKRYLLLASKKRILETRDPSHQAVAVRHAAARSAAKAPAGTQGQGTGTAEQSQAPSAPAQAADDAVAAFSPSYADARARREQADAELRELDLRKRKGEILERADMIAGLDRAFIAAGARLDSIADLLAPQVIGLDDEARARALIAECVMLVRRELARDFAALSQVPA